MIKKLLIPLCLLCVFGISYAGSFGVHFKGGNAGNGATLTQYTFGNSGVPGGQREMSTSWNMMCGQFTSDTGNGTVTKVSIYTTDSSNDADADAELMVGIYANSPEETPDELEGTALGYSAELGSATFDSTGWHDITGGTITSVAITGSTLYWVCVWANLPDVGDLLYVGADNTGGVRKGAWNQAYDDSDPRTWPTEPSGEDNDTTYDLSLMVYYE